MCLVPLSEVELIDYRADNIIEEEPDIEVPLPRPILHTKPSELKASRPKASGPKASERKLVPPRVVPPKVRFVIDPFVYFVLVVKPMTLRKANLITVWKGLR